MTLANATALPGLGGGAALGATFGGGARGSSIGLAGLTAAEAIGQSRRGTRATSMSQRGEGVIVSRAPAPAVAAADADAVPIDLLMDRYSAGEDAALDELYRLAAPRLRAFLARLCADLTLADDLTQDAFLRVHAARGTFAQGAPALPWMFAIARNSYRDHLRREQVRRAHRATTVAITTGAIAEMPEDGGDRAAMARQMLGVVQQALMGLPVRQREAFVLLRFEGLSLAEAALVLGATQAAVKILVHRAYVVVKASLEKQYP